MTTAFAYRTPSAIISAPLAAPVRPAYLRPIASETIAAKLDRLGAPISIARGHAAIEEGETARHFFKVTGGALRAVRLLPDGRRYITSFLLAGDYFGFTQDHSYSQTVEALGDATLIRYTRAEFEALLDSDPRAGRRFFSLMCEELSAVQDRLLLLGRKSAVERLATFLLTLAKRCVPAPGQSEVSLPMSRIDIADYLGLTVETVSRVLGQLRSRKLVDLKSVNHIVFLDRARLEKISAGTALA